MFALNDHQPYTLPTDNPQRYQEIRDVIDEENPFLEPTQNIPLNLQQAMCGGWDFEKEVNGVFEQQESTCPEAEDEPLGALCEDTGGKLWTKTGENQWKDAGGIFINNTQMNTRAKKTEESDGLIAKVTGIPGRDADWALGNIHAGLAIRNQQYTFPTEESQVCGFATACRIDGGRPDGRDNPPFFCSHSCQRPLGGIIPRVDPGDTGPKACGEQQPVDPINGIKYSCGGGAMAQNVCPTLLDGGINGGLCAHLNAQWVYTLYKKEGDVSDEFRKGPCGGPNDPVRRAFHEQITDAGFDVDSQRYCCTDAEIGSEHMNCITCEGENCRNGRSADTLLLPDQWFSNNPPEPQDREYISFFRAYPKAGFERKEFGDAVPDDQNAKSDIPVACFGMYDASPEDARENMTAAEDKRCVIAPYGAFDDMHKTQRGVGSVDPNVPDDPFNDPPRAFNVDQSLWYSRITDSFSMLNDKVFSGQFNGDFSFALLATDSAKQRVTVQLDQRRPFSLGALIRTPDDTITEDKDFSKERRTVVEWWHRVETEMHKNLTPPKVTLLLPTPWSVDLDPLDPIFTPEVILPDLPKPDIRRETIEVQVQAREDLLGEISSLLERQLLLRIEEEPVPIVVPIVNPGEMRAYAQGWEAWAYNQEEIGKPGADEARDVAQGLLAYADHADQARVLRTELAAYATELLGEQKKIADTIADWLEQNIDAYQQYLFLDWGIGFMRYAWGLTQDLYRQSAENDSFPWCRNERFTTPIYSLTDPWLPGREDDGDLTGGFGQYLECFENRCPGKDMTIFQEYFTCIDMAEEEEWPTKDVCEQFFPLPPELPQLPNIQHEEDLVLDFTAFAGVSTTVKLPVLKPKQIRLDFSRIKPPPLTQTTEPRYPDLPPLPTFDSTLAPFINNVIPRVVIPHKEADLDAFAALPTIKMPTVDLLSLLEFMVETYMLLYWMTREYNAFWQSLVLENIRPGTDQDCIRPGTDPTGKCVHFEADLKERFQRIGSRPAIFLKDDLRALGQLRDPLVHGQEYCEQADWSCHLLNATKRMQREGWSTKLSDGYDESILDSIRRSIRVGTPLHPLYDADSAHIIDAFSIPALQP